MDNLLKLIKRVQKKWALEKHRTIKDIKHKTGMNRSNVQQILFVVGCQRSGTSMITKIFEEDLNTKVFNELSSLSSEDKIENLRLNDYADVARQIKASKAPLVIAKPLVESQRLNSILKNFDNANALWMFRPYKDVASSNLRRFGIMNGISNLRYIVNNDTTNWRSEFISKTSSNIVHEYFSEDMNPYDAAALFWYVRNDIYFELNLNNNEKVWLCSYDDLVTSPKEIMDRIYAALGIPYPNSNITRKVKDSSVGKGQEVELSPSIESICDGMLNRLITSYKNGILNANGTVC